VDRSLQEVCSRRTPISFNMLQYVPIITSTNSNAFIRVSRNYIAEACWNILKYTMRTNLFLMAPVHQRDVGVQWDYIFRTKTSVKLYTHWISHVARDEHRANVPEAHNALVEVSKSYNRSTLKHATWTNLIYRKRLSLV